MRRDESSQIQTRQTLRETRIHLCSDLECIGWVTTDLSRPLLLVFELRHTV